MSPILEEAYRKLDQAIRDHFGNQYPNAPVTFYQSEGEMHAMLALPMFYHFAGLTLDREENALLIQEMLAEPDPDPRLYGGEWWVYEDATPENLEDLPLYLRKPLLEVLARA